MIERNFKKSPTYLGMNQMKGEAPFRPIKDPGEGPLILKDTCQAMPVSFQHLWCPLLFSFNVFTPLNICKTSGIIQGHN